MLVPRVVRLRRETKFTDVFAGSFCSFAVAKDSGAVYVWGLNNYGQLATDDTTSPYFPKKSQALSDLNKDNEHPICIASGQHHSIFASSDGKVYSVGRADYGRLGLGDGATHQNLPVEVEALRDHKVHQVACGRW